MPDTPTAPDEDRAVRRRVVHVVTLVSTDGAYGGPVRVAVNLVRELTVQGQQAEIWAAARGYRLGASTVDGVRMNLFRERVLLPRLHFVTTLARGLLFHLLRERHRIDLLHIHFTRDLVVLPVALFARALRIPYVLQPHGQIRRKSHPLARVFDAVFTRPVLRGASHVLCLTAQEEEQLRAVEPRLVRISRLINGVSAQPREVPVRSDAECQVLFLARMHPRKRPRVFARAAVELLSRGRPATFHMVGPDEGELDAVLEDIGSAGRPDSLVYEGPLPPESTNARLAGCDVYVLPSIDEPFPMSVIEAMALGKPVIITDSCGLAHQVATAEAGLVVDSAQDTLTEAIDLLVQDARIRRSMGLRARQLVERDFDITAVTDRLSSIYGDAVEAG